MKVKVGISNRHVHITKKDFKTLFGKETLDIKNELYQPGYFSSTKTVTIKTNKDKIENVRILGPFRKYTQVEISKTDSYKLGINPPIRQSGDLKDAEKITIVGPQGEITIPCCIIPTRHIHISKEDYKKYFNSKKTCSIKIEKEKTTILENIELKIENKALAELHLDTDDGNACLLKQGEEIETN